MYKSNQWPREELLPGWKEETQRIQHKLVEIAMKLIEAFALAMGEEANCLQRWYQGDNSQCSLIRFLRYPPTPTDDRHTGCGAHSDYGLLTLLLQDDIGGLQVLQKDNWIDATPIPGTFVVNIGDWLEFISCGNYKATKHRVRNNSADKDRHVTVFFFEPDVRMPYRAAKKFEDQAGTQVRPKNFGEHLRERLNTTYTM
eukprot:TRINITY_DN894_c0_g1_i12.p1 TRINITY_DN894_c0_g1~~TRINITY_DN894_c0_g1_i12.p1  ORF type:complete len:199 (+),score=27.30 TRINITY_DN894_c0_g1_i12:128-724(+)